MLVVETVARIRREYFVKGKSIKEIVRDLGVSRNTVRKVVRSERTDFTYERAVQPLPKLGPWSADLERLLESNEREQRRERLTLIRIYEELQGLGYRGGYDAVRRYAAGWQRERSAMTAAAFVPLSFAPGEAYQFDWSHEVVVLAGVTTTVKVAHMRLCHSRMFFVRAYPRASQEMVFDAHDRAFAFFGGACQRGIYDNMKRATTSSTPGCWTGALHMPVAPRIQSSRTEPSGRYSSRPTARRSSPIEGRSMDSMRCRRRFRGPCSSASIITNTRSTRRQAGARSKSTPMPSASSSGRTARSSLSMSAGLGGTRPFMTPGIMCRCWRASPGH